MKIKSLALAAAIAVSGLPSAYAATPPASLGLGQLTPGILSTTVGTANGFFNALKTAFDQSGYAGLTSSITGSFQALSDATSSNYFLFHLAGVSDSWGGSLNFNNTTQTITFNSLGFTGNLQQQVAAVPGPEAGAGLGALAIGGLALWMKRRRTDAPLAA